MSAIFLARDVSMMSIFFAVETSFYVEQSLMHNCGLTKTPRHLVLHHSNCLKQRHMKLRVSQRNRNLTDVINFANCLYDSVSCSVFLGTSQRTSFSSTEELQGNVCRTVSPLTLHFFIPS